MHITEQVASYIYIYTVKRFELLLPYFGNIICILFVLVTVNFTSASRIREYVFEKFSLLLN